MIEVYKQRALELQRRMADERIDLFVISDPDSVHYFSGFWGYLGMEFGRPTLLLIRRGDEPVLVTPAMEGEMAGALSWVADRREWMDGVDGEWMAHLRGLLGGRAAAAVAVESQKTHPRISDALRSLVPSARVTDGTAMICGMRMIKSAEEIAVMRQAGEVAVAMVKAGRESIAEGVPEYEVALAIIAAGTRKAAALLAGSGGNRLWSPTIYNLQIMQSGHHTSMVHRRSTVKRIARGDPVYLCFCGIANFKQFKLGFDREFFVGSVTDEMARTYEAAVRAQQAALALIRPGTLAEEVHAAAEDVYRSAGFGPAYRTGRGIGYSFLEDPQLKRGERAALAAGMTFAVDGGVTRPGRFGARIGDSIVVTEQGFDYLTDYPRDLTIV
jgi:Xaa-Pro aminopeptidase